jgi:hypothetical protein
MRASVSSDLSAHHGGGQTGLAGDQNRQGGLPLLQLKRRVLSLAADNVIVTCIWFGGKPLWGGVTTNSLVLLQLKWDKPSARISYNFERK